MKPSLHRWMIAGLFGLLAPLAVQAQTPPAPPADPAAAPKQKVSAEDVRNRAKEARGGVTVYYRDLKNKPLATVEDAYRVACILRNDSDALKAGFEVCRNSCILADVINEGWDYAPESKLTKGMISYIMINALDIPGGVSLSIFGTTQRYALRELVKLKIVSDGPRTKYVTGDELLAILSRSMEYKKSLQPKVEGEKK